MNSIIRSLDFSPFGPPSLSVQSINTSEGVYTWTAFDGFIADNTARQIVFCLGYPPSYLVTRTPAEGQSKQSMCPDDLATWASVVATIVQRAKTAGRVGLVWELWNEIDTGNYTDPIALLGPYTKATAQAILAVDPSAIIATPSISNVQSLAAVKAMQDFLSTPDGGGGTAANWIGTIAYHSYQYPPVDSTETYSGWCRLSAILQNAGIAHLPVYLTEFGFCVQNGGSVGLVNDLQVITDMQRMCLIHAAMGMRQIVYYDFDSSIFGLTNAPGGIAAWNALVAMLRGATITELYIAPYCVSAVINGQSHVF